MDQGTTVPHICVTQKGLRKVVSTKGKGVRTRRWAVDSGSVEGFERGTPSGQSASSSWAEDDSDNAFWMITALLTIWDGRAHPEYIPPWEIDMRELVIQKSTPGIDEHSSLFVKKKNKQSDANRERRREMRRQQKEGREEGYLTSGYGI